MFPGSLATGLTALLAMAIGLSTAPVDLRIIDSKGAEVVVAAAAVDYGGMLLADRDLEGIRLQQGDGTVLAKWATIDTLRITKVDESTRPATITVEVVTRDGKRRTATLLEKGRMLVTGKTDLGEYSIDLKKVRTIIPVR